MTDVTIETQAAKKFDAEAFAMNVARAMESGGRALAAYLKPRESGELQDKPPNELTDPRALTYQSSKTPRHQSQAQTAVRCSDLVRRRALHTQKSQVKSKAAVPSAYGGSVQRPC